MLNWIRWNRNLVVIIVSLAVVVGAGAYTVRAVNSANLSAGLALTLENTLSCETPTCIEAAISAADAGDLLPLLDEIAKQARPLPLQPVTLVSSGGACAVAGRAVGQRVASSIDAAKTAELIAGVKLTASQGDLLISYPCQLAYVAGLGQGLASKVPADQVQATAALLCPELTEESKDGRVSYDVMSTLCLRAAGTFAAQASDLYKKGWDATVAACNAFSATNVVACLNAASNHIRAVSLDYPVNYAGCAESKKLGYCELIVSSTLVTPEADTLAASEDPLSSFEQICKEATSVTACRHGYFLGLSPTASTIDVCTKLGSLEAECTDVIVTRTASSYLRISNQKGDDIKKLCLGVDAVKRCEDIVDNILDYRYEDGLS